MSFLFGAFAAPLRDAPRPLLRVKQDTPRDLGVDGVKERARNRLTGIRTRGSPEPIRLCDSYGTYQPTRLCD